jgi:ferredoxin--NADP+ reductase
VGAGPAGFYTADFLLKNREGEEPLTFFVDMFERLPSPFGLVRSGVAPDHQGIKKVTKVFERITAHQRFHYFGNVNVGVDIEHADLMSMYDQIVYTTGAPTDRQLGVPGEDLAGSHAATTFVGWYNGHPDFTSSSFDLSVPRAVVVGLGNVAMDVARILIQDPERLKGTDIADKALASLRESRVREVVLLGRRGPAEAAFSPKEIRDIDELEGVDLRLEKPALALDLDAASYSGEARKNVEFLKEVAQRPPATAERRVELRFLCSPVELRGDARGLSSVQVEENELYDRGGGRLGARGTGVFSELETRLLFRSIGYRGTPLSGVPFDEGWAVVPNAAGRVTQSRDEAVVPRLYAAGWIKRGPVGLIGTNKTDAKETFESMLEDAERLVQRVDVTREQVEAKLRERGARPISLAEWRIIDELEIANGKKRDKIREKYTSPTAMLEALDAHRPK